MLLLNQEQTSITFGICYPTVGRETPPIDPETELCILEKPSMVLGRAGSRGRIWSQRISWYFPEWWFGAHWGSDPRKTSSSGRAKRDQCGRQLLEDAANTPILVSE